VRSRKRRTPFVSGASRSAVHVGSPSSEGETDIRREGAYACCTHRVGALQAGVGRETDFARSDSANAAEVTVAVMRHGYQ